MGGYVRVQDSTIYQAYGMFYAVLSLPFLYWAQNHYL